MVVFFMMVLLFVLVFFLSLGLMIAGLTRNLSAWNQVYRELGKRYGGESSNGVVCGFMFSNPRLSFDYGRTFCFLRNRKTSRFAEGRLTEVAMKWEWRSAGHIRLEISTQPNLSRSWGLRSMKQIEFDDPEFQSRFYVSCNRPEIARRMLTPGVQWRLERLRQLTGQHELLVTLHHGALSISKPGYLKKYDPLEQLLRLSTELFDQLMLIDANGLEFVNENEAVIVDDVKCPICSQEIIHKMAVCSRCQTPHCLDCWEYNGQCATFACQETNYLRTDTLGEKVN